MSAVLVVGGEAERTAASRALLEHLTWARHHRPELELHVFLLTGGPLVHQFHALAPTTVLEWYDQRDDLAVFVGLARRPWARRLLARLLDHVADTTTLRHLPPVGVDAVVVSGLDAVAAAPLRLVRPWARTVAVHLPASDTPRVTQLRRDTRRRLKRSDVVVVDDPGAPDVLRAAGVDPARIVAPTEPAVEPGLLWDQIGSRPS